jgi:hypothetical protein
MTIRDKDTFKRLQLAGLLGNYFRMWNTVQEVRDAGYTGWLTVRARRASDRALFIPAVHSDSIWGGISGHKLWIAPKRGVDLWNSHSAMSDVYLQEIPAPDTGRVINLEAEPGMNGWKAKADDSRLYVKYALNDPQNLRHSLEQNGVVARGLQAWAVLHQYLAEDIDQLYDIWDRHPDATIEASRFTSRVGVFDSRTIIWEAREF